MSVTIGEPSALVHSLANQHVARYRDRMQGHSPVELAQLWLRPDGSYTGAAVMTQLRRDAAYIRTETRPAGAQAIALTVFDETVCEVLASAHTVRSATKTLATAGPPVAGRAADDQEADLESKVAASMIRLLQAERIELSPDS